MTNGGFIDDDLIDDPAEPKPPSATLPTPPTGTTSSSSASSVPTQVGATTKADWENDPAVIRSSPGNDTVNIFRSPRYKQNPYKGVKKFLVFASGARPEILAECPTDEATHVGLGGTVVATSGLSAVSMFFALNSALHLDAFRALVGAFLWALVIFNLDRWLIVSQKRLDQKWKQWINVIPRVIVALLLGAVISEPLMHQLFRSEIDKEVAIMQNEDDRIALDALESSFKTQIDIKNADLAKLRDTSGLVVGEEASLNQEIERLKKEIADAQAAYNTAQSELTAEIEGISASGKAGCGQACAVKQGIRDQKLEALNAVKDSNNPRIAAKQQELDNTRNQNADARAALAAQRQDQIANTEADIKDLQESQQDQRTRIKEDQGSGLLNDIRALSHLGDRETSIDIAHLLIILLFFALDTIPVVGKTLLLTGPKRPYEKLCDAVDERTELEAQQLVSDAVFENQQREMVLRADADLRTQVEMDNNEYFVKVAGDTQRQVGELLLDKWRQDELERVKGEIERNPPTTI